MTKTEAPKVASLEAGDDLTECPTCKDTGFEICHHIGTGRDEDGWCLICDAADLDRPERIMCRVGHG